MNTTKLIAELSKKTFIPRRLGREVVMALIDKIISEVKKGKQVKITGFGIFYGVQRKARVGRNPQNGTPVSIPEKTVPKFKPGKKFRDGIK